MTIRGAPRVVAAGWLAGLVAAGCATAPEPGTVPSAIRARPCGTVVRVRDAERWVVLDCPLAPAVGAVVGLSRDGAPAARARITAHRRGSYVVAEIVSGRPQAGDVIDERLQGTEERP